MSRLGFALLAFLSAVGAFAADPPPLPDGALARLGYARMVAGHPRHLHITADGKDLYCNGQWFDVESGQRIDSPYRIDPDKYLRTILDDGTAVFESGDTHILLEPGQAVPRVIFQVESGWCLVAPSGKTVSHVLEEGKDETKQIMLRVAAVPKAGQAPAWKEIASGPQDLKSLHFNRAGTKLTWYQTTLSDEGRSDLVHVHDVATGTTTTFPIKTENGCPLKCLRMSNDGTRVVAQLHRKLAVYDAKTGKELHARATSFGNERECQLTRDGRAVFIPDYWDRQLLVPLDPNKPTVEVQLHGVGNYECALFPDSKRVAIADTHGVIRIHDLATGKQIDNHSVYQTWDGVQMVGPNTAACWNRCGDLLTWDLRTGKPLTQSGIDCRDWDGVRMWFSPDGRHVAASSYGTTLVAETKTGKTVFQVKGTNDDEHRLRGRFSPDGRTVAVRSFNDEVKAWRVHFHDVTDGSRRRSIPSDDREWAVSPDGRSLAASSAGELALIEIATGKRRWLARPNTNRGDERTTNRTESLAFDRTGKRIVLVSRFDAFVADAATGREVVTVGLKEATDEGRPVAVSASGRWLAVVWAHYREAQPLSVYDLDGDRPTEPVFTRNVPGVQITGIALDENGSRLVTAHADGTGVVWDLAAWVKPHLRPKVAVKAVDRSTWELLADPDPAVAQKAIEGFLADPDGTVKLFEKQLPAAEVFPEAELTKLVAELGNSDFATRETASKKLVPVADQAEVKLRAAQKDSTSAEQHERLEQVLAKLSNPSGDPERLRQVRAVEILERVGTPDARKLLAKYAAGAPGAVLTREAADSLTRLRR